MNNIWIARGNLGITDVVPFSTVTHESSTIGDEAYGEKTEA